MKVAEFIAEPEVKALDVVSRTENPSVVYPGKAIITESRSFSADVARIVDGKLNASNKQK